MSEPNVHNAQDNAVQDSDTMDANDQLEPLEEILNPVSQQLMEARIRLGLSEEEIAGKLFLNPSRIKYIDSGHFDKIGKPAFLKGYLRSYAREVGLSPDAIIALLNEQDKNPPAPEERLSRVSEHRSHTINTTPAAATAIIGIIGVVLVLLAIWWLNPEKEESTGVFPEADELQDEGQQGQGGTNPPEAQQGDNELASVDSNWVDNVRVTNEQPDPNPGGVSGSVATSASTNRTKVITSTTLSPSQSEQTSQPEASIQANTPVTELIAEPGGVEEVQIKRYEEGGWRVVTVSANGEDHLKFTFTDDCWLEVVDAGGRPVYGDLNHERERLSVFGNAPFKVLIGRVSAVTVSFNEKPVDLQAFAFNDTAKLVIE